MFLISESSVTVFAATMYDDWSNNSLIGWNYTTQGGIVYAAQRILNSAGMSIKVPGFNVSDGYYGTNTYNAIYTYQSDYGLGTDGIIGANTWRSFQNHTYYTGSTGSIQNYRTQYNISAYAYFQKDYYNGWCIYNPSTDQYYLANGVHYTVRTYIPL
ncbi:peptidoglycan-binding protein [Clostridium sp. WILCCON 0269]|uniref:Peptidoglycan-binding protein n=1 Tax=Candidatus Clostridium eludens TaxID=3381663 RepID=A0ABW8SNV2_9CLOT